VLEGETVPARKPEAQRQLLIVEGGEKQVVPNTAPDEDSITQGSAGGQ
jgi:hypothetical protein